MTASVLKHNESDLDSQQRQFLARAATTHRLTALALAHFAAAMVVAAAAPAQAADIVLAEADSSEIQAHVDDLVSERASVDGEIERLEAERSELSALIERTILEFGTVEAQLTRATEVISAADDDLSSKIEPLAELRNEQAFRYEASERAGERLDVIAPRISHLTDRSEDLSANIRTAERALQEAEERERERQETSSRSSTTAVESGRAPASADSVVGFAYDQIGKPYGSGMTGPDAYDCSGLVVAAFSQSGVQLPRTSQSQWAETAPVGRSELAPGDLVFSHGLGHVAIYIGENQVIHATKPGDTVKTASIDHLPVDGYRRVRT
ncbi:C40 family peptidase [Glycomyces algeriensis]|uniref:NlpC/P60 domain-containing protein n=1 Tax=Glycomyces algeriensis TaxID=256037 RepID=A0A9W6LIR8_9ACTN|nr:C40 family peptidase [Glycomyces algeriensis]MDA1367806.1 NlpC/P60 family protein [Glycomyces algeriensis]MDR7351952.1 cell wall-associated NlpC family hydrolase [Glycomyces algeriensis]GLI44685.1 hypothetical protein GALLR39Z86_45350 [Glycomyces algeriensis]